MTYLLYGFGISNTSLAKELQKKGIEFCILDDSQSVQERIKAEGYQLFSEELWPRISLAVISPGVSRNSTNPIVARCRKLGIEVTNDISMFMESCSGFAVGVTGSFGKSTCVALFKHIYDQFIQYISFTSNKFATSKPLVSEAFQIAGNFGIPCFDCDPTKPTVFELSAQQLEISKEPKLEIGVIVNLYEQHLDDFGTMEKYLAAKAKILTNSRIKLIGDGVLGTEFELAGAKRISSKKAEGCAYALLSTRDKRQEASEKAEASKEKTEASGDGKAEKEEEIEKNPNVKILYENGSPIAEIQTHLAPDSVISAYSISREMGIPTEIILSAITPSWRLIEETDELKRRLDNDQLKLNIDKIQLQSFTGLEHRCEILSLQNRVVINDSKSTNIANTVYCLQVFQGLDKVALICGGKYMEQNLQLLEPFIGKIAFVGCIGSSRKIYDYFIQQQVPIYAGSLEECLQKCWETTLPIILSPGHASTDQYKNFEERGNFFKQLCMQMDNYSNIKEKVS